MTAKKQKSVVEPTAQITFVPISDLTKYARNARTHSPEQIAQIAASIMRFGWTSPELADETGTLIAGHGRVMAAEILYAKESALRMASGVPIPAGTVPVMYALGWTKAERAAYVIADNKLALNAGWDDALLRMEFVDLKAEGFDLGLTGFADLELTALFAPQPGEGLTDPDDAPEPPVVPVSRLGDVWLMGEHRLVCGDSTDAATVALALDGAKPHLMATDPPYGVDYDPDWRNRADRANGKPDSARAIGLVQNDKRADWSDAWALFPGDVIYCWHPPGANSVKFYHGLEDSGFPIRMQIIWNKSNFPIGRGDYHVKHEPCWYAVRKGKTGHWAGDRKQSTVWDIPKPSKSETGHSTQKPVECMKRPIENNSQAGEAVYDPFLGSGTTLIAAEMTGRRVHAVELSPTYVDVAVQRWMNYTGREATLQSTGETFAATTSARMGSAGSATSSTPSAKLSRRAAGASAPT